MDMSLQRTLKDVGLNDKEIKVYLALLKNNKATPATLAKITKINRATVYTVGKSLQSKGIIAEDLSGKNTSFTALPPSHLEQLVLRPMRELKEKEPLIKKAVSELSLITANKEYPVPKIRFVEEDQLENFLYENIEKWQQSVIDCDKIWWGTQDSTFLEHYGSFVDWYWKQPFTKGVNMYQVGNESPLERAMHKKHSQPARDVHMSHDVDFTSSIWVGGDYVISIVTKHHPFYLVELHDATLAHNMREVFKKMWKDSKSLRD